MADSLTANVVIIAFDQALTSHYPERPGAEEDLEPTLRYPF